MLLNAVNSLLESIGFALTSKSNDTGFLNTKFNGFKYQNLMDSGLISSLLSGSKTKALYTSTTIIITILER